MSGYSEWRKSPAGAEWFERVSAIRKTDTYRTNQSLAISEFFATERGEELKKLYSELYTGIPRPPEVTEKMKQSLEDFWNSPEGVYRAAEISSRMTDNLPDAPYGPNWNRQRRKAIARDKICQLCDPEHPDNTFALEVHHIYNRRVFGYVLGQNDHFRWANHLHNLITLCKSHHKIVESGTFSIPELFQIQANLHYQKYIMSIKH